MRANTNKLNFYVSDEVRKKLEKLSKDSGLKMTAVITKLISEREIHPLRTDELSKIYNELKTTSATISIKSPISQTLKDIFRIVGLIVW